MLRATTVLLAALITVYWSIPPGTASASAASKAVAKHADLEEPVTWREGGRTMRAWPAPRELAVTRRPGPAGAAGGSQAMAARSAMGAREIGACGRTTFLRLDEPLDRWSFWSRTLPLAAEPSVEAVSPVYYAGPDMDPDRRMALTGHVVVGWGRVGPELAEELEKSHGLTRLVEFPGKAVVYDVGDPRLSLDIARQLAEEPGVAFAYPDWLRVMTPRAVPDDPLFPSQWHLADASGRRGLETVWDSFRGSRTQVVAIVDDGLDTAHPDFAGNLLPGLGRDFVDDDSDPAHALPGEGHGTSCAGVAAARGFNATGVCGVAPWCGLAGVRLLGRLTPSTAASALSWRDQDIAIYTNSWGPPDDGTTLLGPDPLVARTLAAGTRRGRGGLGNIYVWAAGNGRLAGDNANYDGFANSRQTIAVSATDSQGRQSSYSEPGACILVNAPSSAAGLGITTTDRSGARGFDPGAYTSIFGGTSAASPYVAGVAALVLQASPRLSWRDVRQILALSASQNDPGDQGWFTNGAGLRVSHKYGFGRVDAAAAVDLARTWRPLPPERAVQGRRRVDLAIPDNDPLGVTSRIDIAEDLVIEHVEVAFNAPSHTYWSDLRVELTSPAGTTSVLAEARMGGGNFARYDDWRFGSVLHLGESSRGTWSLRVSDRADRDTGVFESWAVTVHGTRRGAGPAALPATTAGLLLLPPG